MLQRSQSFSTLLPARTSSSDETIVSEVFFTSQSKRTEIPQDKMILSSTSDKTVSLAHQVISNSNCIGLNLLGICLEPRCHGLFQSNSKGTNLVIVRTTLKGGKDG
ncbi:hypothetical protein Lal_00006294, partial [Lupinus albus]